MLRFCRLLCDSYSFSYLPFVPLNSKLSAITRSWHQLVLNSRNHVTTSLRNETASCYAASDVLNIQQIVGNYYTHITLKPCITDSLYPESTVWLGSAKNYTKAFSRAISNSTEQKYTGKYSSRVTTLDVSHR